jgi:trypsin
MASSTSPYEPTEVTETSTQTFVKEDNDQKQQCFTPLGVAGFCAPISDCFTLVVPENGTVPTRNRVLAEMLVESSGFCDGVNVRTDLTPTIFEQVFNSEIHVCCPDKPETPPNRYKLDDIDQEVDVYGEMYKKRSCGYLGKTFDEETSPAPEEPAFCDPEKEDCGKIVKGRKTKIGEFPWVVALMNRNRQFCGGSLINQNTVLTAAHCVQHMTARDVRNLKLHIGDYDIYKKNEVHHEVRGAKAIKYHKGFSMKNLHHDIALVILDKPVEYSATIQAVCLHSGNPEVEDGKQRAEVAGWGALSEGGSQPSDLRAVNVRVLTHEHCEKRYSKTSNKIGNGMICAGSDMGEDSCQGDSGGPLTVDSKDQAKQIGIVSWGIGCGRYPGVYTAVYRYLSWINTNMVRGMGYE